MIAACSCGNVELETSGPPILSAVCYCDDCQAGARQIEALPNAPPVTDPDGGSPYILFRKDRVACRRGADLLRNYKLKETSATNRVVATCCNSAMQLSFDRGPHWVSMFRGRFRETLPPLEWRLQTKFKPAGIVLPSDVPAHAKFPLRFLAKLVGSRIAMLLGR